MKDEDIIVEDGEGMTLWKMMKKDKVGDVEEYYLEGKKSDEKVAENKMEGGDVGEDDEEDDVQEDNVKGEEDDDVGQRG